MKVVSVINYKGGVGKTTLTANLASYVASKGKNVLVIDIDPQTHLTFYFIDEQRWKKDYKDDKTICNFFRPIIEELDNKIPLSSLIIPLSVGRVKFGLISSNLSLIDTDIELAFKLPSPTIKGHALNFLKVYSYLREGLAELKNIYDLVLIDCPPNFYATVKNAITASDYYLIPTRMDYLSTLGTKQLIENINNHVNEYQENISSLNTGRYKPIFISALGIIPTMVTIKDGSPIQVEQEYIKPLKASGYHIFPFVRNNSSVFGSKPFRGVPAILTSPKLNLTARRIVNELKILGDDFMKRVGI